MRVHPLGGPHPLSWNELRRFGPTHSRFDHQPEPPHTDPALGIAYLTVNHRRRNAFVTAIGEVAQRGGTVLPVQIEHPDDPYVTAFDTATELNLLDLTSAWVTRAGGNNAVSSGSRVRSRAWARLIHEHHPTIDGLYYESSIHPPGRCIALWERGEHCFPDAPLASRSFADLASLIGAAARTLGTTVI